MISILCPVLARPQNARPLVDSIRSNTTVPHEIIFLCTEGDLEQIKACDECEVPVWFIGEPAGKGNYAKKINAGFSRTSMPFVFTAADDVTFTPGWDTAILAEAERTGAGMVGSQDEANPLVKRGKHSTHSLFRRSYIDEVGGTFFDGPGIVYHEKYAHQWIDTEAVKAAMDRGEWAFARRSVVRHHHPFYDKTVRIDPTYKKALGDASHDSMLYRERVGRWTRERRAA